MVDEFEFPENFEEISNNTLMRLENDYKIFNNNNINHNTKIDDKNNEKIEKENNDNKIQYEVFEDEDEEEVEEKNIKENISDIKENEEEKNKNEIKENKDYQNLEKNNMNEKREMESNSKHFILKNSDKIKEMISKIKFPPPEWAKNISDDEFINQVKRVLNNNNK